MIAGGMRLTHWKLRRWSGWLLGALTGYVLALCTPVRAWAQESSEPEQPGLGHILGNEPVVRADSVATEAKPMPWERTRIFPVFECGLAGVSGFTPGEEITLELGAMRPLADSRWAFGASFEAGLADKYVRLGGNLRFRRWFSRDVSLDLVPGVFAQDRPPYSNVHPIPNWGVSMRANLLYRNLVGVFGAVDAMPPVERGTGTGTRLRLGLRTSSYATWAAAIGGILLGGFAELVH